MEESNIKIKETYTELNSKDYFIGIGIVRDDGVSIYLDSKDPLISNRSASHWATVFNTMGQLSKEVTTSPASSVSHTSNKKTYIFQGLDKWLILCIFVKASYDKKEFDDMLEGVKQKINILLRGEI